MCFKNTTIAFAAALLASPTAWAGPLITNGDFSQATETGATSCGVAPSSVCSEELGGTSQTPTANDLTGWHSSGYNFLFTPGVATGAGAPTPEYGQGSTLSLWGMANGGSNTWNGNGPGNGTGNFIAMDGDYPGNTGALTQQLTGLTQGTVYAISFSFAFAQQYGFSGATDQNLIISLGSDSVDAIAGGYQLGDHDFSGWMTDTVYFEATGTSELLSFLAYGTQPLPPFALLAGVSAVDAPEPSSLPLYAIGFASVIGFALRRRPEVRPGLV